MEALRVLEEATVTCQQQSIDTPEVRQALVVVDPYCLPKWKVKKFRNDLIPDAQNGAALEGQQQVLRVYFSGIYTNIRQLLARQVKLLNYRYKKSNDPAVKTELDRLSAELEKLPERWKFVPR